MNKNIQKLLLSDKTEEINKGIELFGRKGSLKELPLILGVLDLFDNNPIESQIIETVSNIKVKEAHKIIIDAILKSKQSTGNLRAYMQICWQSALDFAPNIALFIEIFIEGDYRTALEAFTVIENILLDSTYKDKDKRLFLDTINNHLKTMDSDKLTLAKELILVLES